MKHWAVLVAGILFLSACASGGDKAGRPANPLEGSEWQLTGIDGEPLAEGVNASLQFASATSVNGNSGCNSFVGAVSVGERRIVFGQLASTRMACRDDAMTLEQRVLDILAEAAAYRIDQGNLLLLGGSGRRLATFTPL